MKYHIMGGGGGEEGVSAPIPQNVISDSDSWLERSNEDSTSRIHPSGLVRSNEESTSRIHPSGYEDLMRILIHPSGCEWVSD